MGDLIPLPSTSGQLVVPDREKQLADYEKRLKEAQELEAKLKRINEEVPGRLFTVSGSCAGAGSGDFHYYRQIRRAEQDRLRRMDAEEAERARLEEHEARLKERQQAAEDKTAKNRGKRQRKKEKQRAAKLAKGSGGGGSDGGGGGGGGDKASAAAREAGGESSGAEQPDLD